MKSRHSRERGNPLLRYGPLDPRFRGDDGVARVWRCVSILRPREASSKPVIPAKAGIHSCATVPLDPRFRGDDDVARASERARRPFAHAKHSRNPSFPRRREFTLALTVPLDPRFRGDDDVARVCGGARRPFAHAKHSRNPSFTRMREIHFCVDGSPWIPAFAGMTMMRGLGKRV